LITEPFCQICLFPLDETFWFPSYLTCTQPHPPSFALSFPAGCLQLPSLAAPLRAGIFFGSTVDLPPPLPSWSPLGRLSLAPPGLCMNINEFYFPSLQFKRPTLSSFGFPSGAPLPRSLFKGLCVHAFLPKYCLLLMAGSSLLLKKTTCLFLCFFFGEELGQVVIASFSFFAYPSPFDSKMASVFFLSSRGISLNGFPFLVGRKLFPPLSAPNTIARLFLFLPDFSKLLHVQPSPPTFRFF